MHIRRHPRPAMSDTRQSTIRSLSALRGTTLLIAVAATTACGSTPASTSDTIEEERFIATYVDLRVAALETEDRTLTDSARTAVLARHVVTEAQLMAFADVHGRDVEFMNGVWDEVELRLDAARPDTEER